MILTPLIALALRAAARLPRSWAVYPVGFYIRQALLALKVDDLDAAVQCFEIARSKDFGHDQLPILKEIIQSEIEFRISALEERHHSANDAQRAEADKGLAILKRFKSILAMEEESAGQNSTRP